MEKIIIIIIIKIKATYLFTNNYIALHLTNKKSINQSINREEKEKRKNVPCRNRSPNMVSCLEIFVSSFVKPVHQESKLLNLFRVLSVCMYATCVLTTAHNTVYANFLVLICIFFSLKITDLGYTRELLVRIRYDIVSVGTTAL